MATQSRSTLKNWFLRGLKPLASQFSDWMDSYWHKTEDEIPIANIDGLQDALTLLASTASVEALIASLANVVIDCGGFDASGGTFPASPLGTGALGAINRGNQFDIIKTGTLAGINLPKGSTIRARKNNPGNNWTDWNLHE